MIEFSLTLPRFHDFVGHHSFSPEVKDEAAPFVFLAAIGAHTERMRFGTGVYLAGLHHAANIVEQVSTLDPDERTSA